MKTTNRSEKTGFLTIDEFCELLGVPRSTFNDWRAKKRAPRVVKLPNGKLRIRKTVAERWIEEHEEEMA